MDLKKMLLKLIEIYRYKAQERLIQQSGLFDAEYYLSNNLDVQGSECKPLEHFIKYGWLEGRDPSDKFNTLFYLNCYRDVQKAGSNPLIHYISSGKTESRACTEEELICQSGLFDEAFYCDAYPDVVENGIDPLAHFINIGWKEGRKPTYWFDTVFYSQHYSDVADSNVNPLVHYIMFGQYANLITSQEAIIVNSEWFDEQFYQESYPEVTLSYKSPIEHYIHEGAKMGYNPNSWFCTRFYLEYNQDVACAGVNPLFHYIVAGKREGRPVSEYDFIRKNNLFDEKYYSNQYQEVGHLKMDPLGHFLAKGAAKGYKPFPDFDPVDYLEKNIVATLSSANYLLQLPDQYNTETKLALPKTPESQYAAWTRQYDELPKEQKQDYFKRLVRLVPATLSGSSDGYEGALCFVTEELFPSTGGGIGQQVYETVCRLTKRNVPVIILLVNRFTCVVNANRHFQKKFPGKQISVYHVDETIIRFGCVSDFIAGKEFSSLHYYYSYKIALALRGLSNCHAIKGVEFCDFNGLAFVPLNWRASGCEFFRKISFWVRLHGTAEIILNFEGVKNYAIDLEQRFHMERYSLDKCDAWIGPSASIVSLYHHQYGLSCKHNNVLIAPPAYSKLAPANCYDKTFSTDGFHILFLGKLQHVKGVNVVIRAVEELLLATRNDVVVHLVGHTVSYEQELYIDYLKQLISSENSERFIFHGVLEKEEIVDLALNCSCAVVPSLFETFCLAAHELNWIGIPLILNDIPAFSDYFVDSVNCWKFDGTHSNLSALLDRLINNPNLLSDMVWNAKEITPRCRVGSLYSELFDKLDAENIHNDLPLLPKSYEDPRVSVIIPYYNMENYIEDALRSVHNCEYVNWEVIFVNDGSTNRRAQHKFKQLKDKYKFDPRFVFLSQDNRGLGNTRNVGIGHASGKYILPLDCDNILHPAYIRKAVTALEMNPNQAGIVTYAHKFSDNDGIGGTAGYILPYGFCDGLILIENGGGDACSLIRRQVFDRLQYAEDLKAYEDWDLWIQMREEGMEIGLLPEILFHYRVRDNSMLHGLKSSQLINEQRKMIMRHTRSLEKGKTFLAGFAINQRWDH